MNERERRKRQLIQARRLLAKVQRERLGREGDRPDTKAALVLRRLALEMALGTAGRTTRGLPVDIEELGRRIRGNKPGWSVDIAALRVARHLGRGRRQTKGMGDPTTDYDDDVPVDGAGRDRGPRPRSTGRKIRKARSGKL